MPPILLLLFVLGCVAWGAPAAALDVPSMPPPGGMPPPPPSKPDFSDPYFTLTWTWTGAGFSISSSGVAHPSGGSGITNTGSLVAIESWTLVSDAGGPHWQDTGLSGYATKGTSRIGMPGYSTYSCSESSTANLPKGDVFMGTKALDSVTVPEAGSVTSARENTTTYYSAGGAVAAKFGESWLSTTAVQPTTDWNATMDIAYQGLPGQTEEVTTSDVVTYRDSTKKLLAGETTSTKHTRTTLYELGKVASTWSDTWDGKTTFGVTSDKGGGNQASAVSFSDLDGYTEGATYNRDGSEASASSVSRSWTRQNHIATIADGSTRALPDHSWAEAVYTTTVAGQQMQQTTFKRVTAWTFDGHPQSLIAECTKQVIQNVWQEFAIIWNPDGSLNGASLNNVLIPSSAATADAYGRVFETESTMMGIPPAEGDYPFYPWIDAGVIPGAG
jgi:hypothetical protein